MHMVPGTYTRVSVREGEIPGRCPKQAKIPSLLFTETYPVQPLDMQNADLLSRKTSFKSLVDLDRRYLQPIYPCSEDGNMKNMYIHSTCSKCQVYNERNRKKSGYQGTKFDKGVTLGREPLGPNAGLDVDDEEAECVVVEDFFGA